jgi:hypothetical protein
LGRGAHTCRQCCSRALAILPREQTLSAARERKSSRVGFQELRLLQGAWRLVHLERRRGQDGVRTCKTTAPRGGRTAAPDERSRRAACRPRQRPGHRCLRAQFLWAQGSGGAGLQLHVAPHVRKEEGYNRALRARGECRSSAGSMPRGGAVAPTRIGREHSALGATQAVGVGQAR